MLKQMFFDTKIKLNYENGAVHNVCGSDRPRSFSELSRPKVVIFHKSDCCCQYAHHLDKFTEIFSYKN